MEVNDKIAGCNILRWASFHLLIHCVSILACFVNEQILKFNEYNCIFFIENVIV